MPTVMGLFQSPHSAEKAVLELSLNGFTEKDVAMVIFSAQPHSREGHRGIIGWLLRGGLLGDTIDRTDGTSIMDGVGVGAVIFCLLGVIWGSQMRLGPVAMGVFGLLGGGLLGLIIDRLIPEKRRDQLETSREDGMILVQVTSLVAARAEAALRLLKGNDAKQTAVLPAKDAQYQALAEVRKS